MADFRVVAISTEMAESVRTNMRDPRYGFPAHAELASEAGPCRHCLRLIKAGAERQILFTADRFAGVEGLPQPGPIYVHEEDCERFPENGGFPDEMRGAPRTLEAYARGRKLLAQEYVTDGKMEPVIERMLSREDVDYIQVCSTQAGCYTFRIERI